VDTLQAIRTRRSIRRFTPEPVAGESVQQLLAAAMCAPSAANQQAWHFVIVDERELLDRVPEFHDYCPFIREAPLAVVVCGDLNREQFAGRFWVQDCSAATQNLLLAAHELGLGAVWCAVYPVASRDVGLRRLLNLPQHLVPLNLVVVGHPAAAGEAVDRYDSGRITWNRFA